jgi:hypothetical protein
MGEADSHSFLVICRFRLAATIRVAMRPLLACLVPVIRAQAGIPPTTGLADDERRSVRFLE